jgi:DMSO/TMAO reductase YedYZ molybdopterin-dependent catalytic subunit
MRRRQFVALLAGGGLLVPASSLLADSILVSKEPRVSEFDLQSLEGRYTPVQDFYVRNHYPVPAGATVNALSISGEVQRPVTVSHASLTSLKPQKLGAVLECSGDGTGPLALASNGLWEGWSLHDVLAMTRPTAQARFLLLTGADGFRRSIALDQVSPQALLATRLNGQPLTAEHGAPWRALIPGLYGMQSVKWLKHIELASEPLPVTTDEYASATKSSTGVVKRQELPPVLVKSVITYPVMGEVLHPGTVTLRGLAWSGSGKIAAVEITTDGGKSWRLARLDPGSRYEWTIWHYTVGINGTGVAEFGVRAVDEKGNEQPLTRSSSRLDPYANNTIERIQFLVQ